MQEFCCEMMEYAVREARWVKFTNVIDNGDPDYDTYYVEVVKEKVKKGKWGISGTEVITEDLILKHCLFCGRVL